jgi:hypothetical protein
MSKLPSEDKLTLSEAAKWLYETYGICQTGTSLRGYYNRGCFPCQKIAVPRTGNGYLWYVRKQDLIKYFKLD